MIEVSGTSEATVEITFTGDRKIDIPLETSRLLGNVQFTAALGQGVTINGADKPLSYDGRIKLFTDNCSGPVAELPTAAVDPASQTVEIGGTARFTVTATGGQLHYQWQYSTDGGSTWADLAGENGTVLTIVTDGNDNGRRYRCKVWNSAGTVYSNVAALTTTYMLKAPVLLSAEAVKGGVQVKWQASDGAAVYRVYCKSEAETKWKRAGDATGTVFTDTNVVSGTAYTYTVRCMNADKTDFTSGFDTTGLAVTYVATPAITAIESVKGGVRLGWSAEDGAEVYRMYRKGPSDTKWQPIGYTTGTSYTDTNVVSGVKYAYTEIQDVLLMLIPDRKLTWDSDQKLRQARRSPQSIMEICGLGLQQGMAQFLPEELSRFY